MSAGSTRPQVKRILPSFIYSTTYFHLIPDLFALSRGAQKPDPRPKPRSLGQRPGLLVLRLDADGATWPVQWIEFGVQGHALSMEDTEIMIRRPVEFKHTRAESITSFNGVSTLLPPGIREP